ncbi:MAG: NAD(P)-binding protein [Bacillota bacterium]
MKVGIIGAGLSGLYCAIELERLGVKPVIYERNSYIGEPFSHVTAILNITHRPIKDLLVYIKKEMNVDVRAHNVLNSLVHNGPNITSTYKGSFGYLFKYSKDPDSLKNQLYSMLRKTEVRFNEAVDCMELSRKYDYVVIADGTYQTPNELGCWQQWLKAYVRGAVVLGDFDPTALIMWINKDYAKNGYVYLTPFDSKKASLVLIATDVNQKEIDRYWELFLYTENIKYTMVEEFKLEHRSGYVYPHIVDNMILIGNAGGGVEPFLGFGHLNAVTMAFAAARYIVKGKNYEKQIKGIMDRNLYMREFRKAYNMMTNKSYDMLVTALKLPGTKRLVYDSNINVSKYGAFVLKNLTKNKMKL